MASVEGEAFTAEVVAQVRGAAEYEIVGQLSRELDRRHRLVASEGSRWTAPSGQRASRYRFRHILLQQYVYAGLDAAERVYLHEAVGNALEQVYAGQTEAIALQLAWHFYAAARMDKAVDYYLQAGARARELYAHAEAYQHYTRALDALGALSDTIETRLRRADALIAITRCFGGADSLERNLARLAEAERLVGGSLSPDEGLMGDGCRLGRVRLGMGLVHYERGATREAIAYYQQALSLARESGDTELIASSSSAIGSALVIQGHHGRAEALLRQAIPLFERSGNGPGWCHALSTHGGTLVMVGEYAGGLAEIECARAWAQEMNVLSEILYNSYHLNVACMAGGDLPRAIEVARQTIEMAERSGNQIGVYVGHFHASWAASRAGQYAAAAAHAAKAQAMAQELGEPLIHADHLAAFNAEITFGAGRAQEAIALAEQAVDIAQEVDGIFAEGLARRTWGQALAALEPPQWEEAEDQLAHSVRLLEAGQARLEAARTHVAWGAVCRNRGDSAAARAHWGQAVAQWETSGLAHELARTRALIESAAPE